MFRHTYPSVCVCIRVCMSCLYRVDAACVSQWHLQCVWIYLANVRILSWYCCRWGCTHNPKGGVSIFKGGSSERHKQSCFEASPRQDEDMGCVRVGRWMGVWRRLIQSVCPNVYQHECGLFFCKLACHLVQSFQGCKIKVEVRDTV